VALLAGWPSVVEHIGIGLIDVLNLTLITVVSLRMNALQRDLELSHFKIDELLEKPVGQGPHRQT
jgi:hypothetical protein